MVSCPAHSHTGWFLPAVHHLTFSTPLLTHTMTPEAVLVRATAANHSFPVPWNVLSNINSRSQQTMQQLPGDKTHPGSRSSPCLSLGVLLFQPCPYPEGQKDLSSKRKTTPATQCPKKVKEKDATIVKPSLPISLHRKVDSTQTKLGNGSFSFPSSPSKSSFCRLNIFSCQLCKKISGKLHWRLPKPSPCL